MEKINELITSIIEISFDNLPVEEGWGSYEINAYALRKMIEINAFYLQNDGKKISFNPKYQGQVDRENSTYDLVDRWITKSDVTIIEEIKNNVKIMITYKLTKIEA